MKRYVRWQVGSLLAPGPVAVNFVDDSMLLASFGMAAATGNIYSGLYEFEDMAFVLHYLRPSDLFVDVGANIGAYTILAAAAVGARCITLEPVPTTFKHLRRNLQLNDLLERVDARNVAAGARPGAVKFTAGLGPMNRMATDSDRDVIEVPVEPLDEIVGDRVASVLKIDVEGFETEVVRGARRVLENPSLNVLLIERNGSGARFGFDEEALHRQLQSFGLRPFRYRPLDRQLTEMPSAEPSHDGNVLYLRDPALAAVRVKEARTFRVNGRML